MNIIENAEYYMRQRQFSEALELWRAVREKFPSCLEGYTRAVLACMELNDFAQAEELCLEGQKNVSAALGPWVQYAECAMRQRDFATALKRWGAVREKFPLRPEGYARAAQACMELNDFAQAETFCLEGQKKAPTEPWAWLQYAECAMRRQNFELALERWGVVRERFLHRPEGYARAAQACMELSDFTQAEDFCLEGQKNASTEPWPWLQYAECAMRRQNFDLALERWEAVREKFPSRSEGYARAALVCMGLNDFAQAETLCLEGQKNAPADPWSWLQYAECAMRRRDFELALERWGVVREKFPNRPEGYVRAAAVYRLQRKYEQAEAICREGLSHLQYESKESCASILYTIADNIVSRDKNPEEALQFLLSLYEKDQFYCGSSAFWRKLCDVSAQYANFIAISKQNLVECENIINIIGLFIKEQRAQKDAILFLFINNVIEKFSNQDILSVIRAAIQKYNVKNDFSILFGVGGTASQKKKSLLNLICLNQKCSIHIFNLLGEKRELFESIIDEIISTKEWRSFNEQLLFSFARLVDFFDQSKADKFISELLQVHCNSVNRFAQVELLCLERQKLVPAALGPWLQYAECAMRRRNFTIALERWGAVREKFPSCLEGYTRAALACMELNDFAQAEALCLEGQKHVSSALGPWLQYAECAMRRQNFELALERWGAVREKFPNRPEGYVRAALACMELNNFAQAEALCLEGQKIVSADPWAWLQYAECAMRRQNFDLALERWKAVRERFPNRPEGYVRAALACMELNDFAQAEALCLEGQQHAPVDPWPWLQYAECAMRRQNFELALERWGVVREKFPNRPEGYVRAAMACMELNVLAQAEALCLEGQRHVPAAFGPWLYYAECVMRQRNFDMALERWKAVREKFPNRPEGYARAALACMELNDFAQAEALCLEGQKHAPMNPWPWLHYAECAMRRQNLGLALERWGVVREKFPNRPEGYIRAAAVYRLQQDYEQAEAICRKGLSHLQYESKESYASLLYAIADNIALKEENPEEALQFLLSLYQRDSFYCGSSSFWRKLCDISVKYASFLAVNKMNLVECERLIDIIALFLREQRAQKDAILFLFTYSLMYEFSNQALLSIIRTAIQKYNIKSDFAILFEAESSVSQQKKSLFNLICLNQKNLIHIVKVMEDKRELFESVIDEILSTKKWRSFDEATLFSFVRLTNFFDQSKADKLISELPPIDCNKDIGTPMGILNFRQANQAVLSISGAPYLDIRKRLNVAICISGQLRGYEDSFSRLMKSFDFDKHTTRVFVHTWKNIGRKFPVVIHAFRSFSGKFLSAYQFVLQGKDVKSFLQANYINFFNLLSASSLVSDDRLKDFYKTDHIVVEDDSCAPFNAFSNPEKMHYKIYQSFHMATLYDFDLVIRTRPDLPVVRSGARLRELYDISMDKKALLVARKYVVGLDYAIDDRFAIATSQIMNIYSRTYYDMKTFFWKKYAYRCPNGYTGHANLEYQLFAHGVRVEELKGISFAPLQDSEPIPITAIYEALKKDIATRTPTPEDEMLLQACEEDIALLAAQQDKI